MFKVIDRTAFLLLILSLLVSSSGYADIQPEHIEAFESDKYVDRKEHMTSYIKRKIAHRFFIPLSDIEALSAGFSGEADEILFVKEVDGEEIIEYSGYQYRTAGHKRDTSDWIFEIGLLVWGLDLGVTYRGFRFFDDLETRLIMQLSGAYEEAGYYRNPDDTPYDPPRTFNDSLAPYNRLSLRYGLGIEQALLMNRDDDKPLLSAFTLSKGRYDKSIREESKDNQLIFDSTVPDRDAIFQQSFIAGLYLDNVSLKREHQLRDGFRAETSIEFAPELFVSREDSQFLRWNSTFCVYIPLIDIDKSTYKNIFSVNACQNIGFDCITGGENIPFYVRSSFGGFHTVPGIISRSLRPGLGGAVRGIETYRYDGYIKALSNSELRFNLPTINPDGRIPLVPGILLFFDVGMYDDLSRKLKELPNKENVFYSTGGALYVYVHYLGEIGVQVSYFINEERWRFSLFGGYHF